MEKKELVDLLKKQGYDISMEGSLPALKYG